MGECPCTRMVVYFKSGAKGQTARRARMGLGDPQAALPKRELFAKLAVIYQGASYRRRLVQSRVHLPAAVYWRRATRALKSVPRSQSSGDSERFVSRLWCRQMLHRMYSPPSCAVRIRCSDEYGTCSACCLGPWPRTRARCFFGRVSGYSGCHDGRLVARPASLSPGYIMNHIQYTVG